MERAGAHCVGFLHLLRFVGKKKAIPGSKQGSKINGGDINVQRKGTQSVSRVVKKEEQKESPRKRSIAKRRPSARRKRPINRNDTPPCCAANIYSGPEGLGVRVKAALKATSFRARVQTSQFHLCDLNKSAQLSIFNLEIPNPSTLDYHRQDTLTA